MGAGGIDPEGHPIVHADGAHGDRIEVTIEKVRGRVVSNVEISGRLHFKDGKLEALDGQLDEGRGRRRW